MTATPQLPLDVAATFAGKRILFTGATGFLGQVALSLLLHRYGDALDCVWVLVRRGSAVSAERRFFDKVVPNEPFRPLREKYGDGVTEFFARKCRVLDGDITDPGFGLSAEQLAALDGQVDAVINSAGLVSFNPSLELALDVNTLGVRHGVELCQRWKVPLSHVSTAFVVGNRSGLVFEDDAIEGYFPKKGELDGRDFSLDQELADCRRTVERLRERAEDRTLTSSFRERALSRLAQEGRDARDEKTLRLAVGRERKLWLSGELTRVGMERAAHWGWPNTYTYSKSLGEQVLAGTPGLSYAILRPSIVESALRYPFPGWNEGFTTSAPLSFACIKGRARVPAGTQTILDIVPVDLVASALLAATARVMASGGRRVYHLASGDVNPFYAARSVELVGLYRRRYYREKKTGSRAWNHFLSRLEPQAVSLLEYKASSAPAWIQGAKLLKGVIQEVKPSWGAPAVSAWMDRAVERLDRVEEEASGLATLVELFLPFIWTNRYVFRCDNTRAVYAGLTEADRERIPWAPERLDWRQYFLEVHLPGLERWVFPGLEEATERRTSRAAHRDLLELFDAAVHAHRERVAFRRLSGEREERFTYGEVHRYAARVGSFLLRCGVKTGDRVMLASENRPEWGMSYFGILRAGATAVPVDPELSSAEVVNVARRSGAVVCLISEEAAHSLPGLFRALAEAGVETQVHSLAQAMAGDDAYPDRIAPVRRSAPADAVASLLFTSGTTGQPKGVMLTHRNFTALVAKLAGAFDLQVGDGVLSVLPLHHTFEFSCGFLTPFSLGAEVTYLDELNSDRLGQALEGGRISAMVGVPALWQLMHKKVTQELAARPAWVEHGVKALMAAHGELRDRANVNLGKLLFWPVHRKFGGHLKFLVSGGSALAPEVAEAFHAFGFTLSEGYGLTEAAPVLAVGELAQGKPSGTVGKPLPGIDLRILDPNVDGVGEVLAKGPNVMAGYFQDAEATAAVLKDGWLHTGDLGRLDGEGRLHLAGRKKDVIIDANGKNVFPDELEPLYARHDWVKEVSVVGLPDASGGEKVACLCVPDYADRPRDEVRRALEEHFRQVSAALPFYRRVKVLRFSELELPKTPTRKVKRSLVLQELLRQERLDSAREKALRTADRPGAQRDWLEDLVAEVCQKPATQVGPETRLVADLGFDSLLLAELGAALERAGVSVPALGDLTRVETVADLRALLAVGGKGSGPVPGREPSAAPRDGDGEIPVPAPVARAGRALLAWGQRALYGGVFGVKVSGKSFIPQNRNFLVVSNHASHLDMGLIKVVLGDQGERLVALAARDYFFDTPLKRAYFENFTHLIPMDRNGSLRESLRLAGEALQQGHNLLIFPEGTRSPTGELLEFKSTLGYLAMTYGMDVLPLYLDGTYDALPKGSVIPKRAPLHVRIGPALMHHTMKRRFGDLSRSDGYRQVTQWAEEAIKALRDGRVAPQPDPAPTAEPAHPLKTSGHGRDG